MGIQVKIQSDPIQMHRDMHFSCFNCLPVN